jgi:UDP-N-acetylglucosamine--N-acetylmuramyl-(pentapeptide) pyrophosphoryl-undecaprenol N-acetylglucosamine transferase
MTGEPIMIVAGGTGGHVFPGLAVAEVLQARHSRVVWLGTHRGLEARLVPGRGIDMEWISIAGIRGRGVWAWISAPFRVARAVLQALGALRRRRPGAVLGLGGFVAGPGGLAAWLTRRPLVIHEQNAVAGTTNRLLARFAARVFAAFPNAFPAGVAAEVIGNPIRREFGTSEAPRARLEARRGQRRRVFVLGGSQGARVLNRTLPAALAALPADARPEVLHQAGSGAEETRKLYAQSGVEARVEEFIDDVMSAYCWADLVVARAGALTVAELAAVGIGAVLVPLRYAIDDHQTANARHFVAGGAGVLLPELELTPQRLAQELSAVLTDFGRLLAMAEAARAKAQVGAAETLAAACLELAEARR